ncbi:MAG: hypothetical protein AAF449_14520, partial [Myxococcota bacterium]
INKNKPVLGSVQGITADVVQNIHGQGEDAVDRYHLVHSEDMSSVQSILERQNNLMGEVINSSKIEHQGHKIYDPIVRR